MGAVILIGAIADQVLGHRVRGPKQATKSL